MRLDHKWLVKWASYLKSKKVLELGCGQGIDTQIISSWAECLVACDLNPGRSQANNVTTIKLDHSKVLPFVGGEFDVVVASLCLHYFSWDNTQKIIKDISRLLAHDGVLICRLNSDQDTHYGATGYAEIEPGLFEVNGNPKRFFSERDVLNLFSDQWEIKDIQHKTIDRYEMPKSIWELSVVCT